ncbi:general substrate transporter [Hyaloscypha bicolor E]|uniref:General substrate transporter n=1 Tax=Hyaloscypha bicolor E TaxID=1095630 RepID=A0A2J6TEI1_9HELO|nr:general substrate transporter [Hyaloscypha bicolor E]PMD61445.1 general substrate transporter [Hyaloscypha bicolor E]
MVSKGFSFRSIGIMKPEGVPGSSATAIGVGLFVAFGGILFGYDTGTIGGIIAMPHWLKTFSTGYINPDTKGPGITANQSSLIVSILSAGTFFGALTAAPTADFTGRRMALMITLVVFCFGVLLQTISVAIPLFVAGRFLAGFGVGLISALIPLYQSETAPKWIRGTVVGAYQLAITIGLLIAAVVDNATKDRADSGSYRIPIAIQFFWAIILGVGLLFLPETPRYLIRMGRDEKAAKSLSRLRRLPIDNPFLIDELADIKANYEHELSLGTSSYKDFLTWHTLGKRLMTGCLLQSLQQLTGINFIFYYGTSFFTNSGIQNPFVTTMITSAVNVASTFPGLYLVETWGRRRLLLFGAIGMFVSQMIVASAGTAFPGTTNMSAQKALVAFVCVYIFFFASSWGPVAWVVTGEIFPLGVRAKGLSMTTASNWLLNWAIAYSTPYLVNPGPGNANLQAKIFFLWGGCCLVCAFFVWALIYETKGLSLEEVDEMYEKVDKAWKSNGFVPSREFRQEDKNTGAVGSGKKLKDDVPVVDHSSEHTEVNGVTTESSE